MPARLGDVDLLSMAGVPIVTTQGSGGGIRLMEGYTLDKNLLTKQEQLHLVTALQTLQAAQYPGVDTALEKIRGLVQQNPRADWLHLDFSPWGADDQEGFKFHQLRQGILEYRLVSFDYVSAVGQRTQRVVEPLQLCYKGDSWYLSAWCKKREALRLFRITRMHRTHLLDQHFVQRKLPATPPSAPPEESLIHLHLRFHPCVEYRLLDEYPDCMIHRCEDGFLEVSPTYPEDDWVYGHLLSFGAHVEVLSPPYAQKRMRDTIDRMQKIYQPKHQT